MDEKKGQIEASSIAGLKFSSNHLLNYREDGQIWKTYYQYISNQWLKLSFDRVVQINGFRTMLPDGYSQAAFKDFTLESTMDGNHWSKVVSGTRSNDCCFWITETFGVVFGQQFKLTFHNNWGGDHLVLQKLELSFASCKYSLFLS